MFCIFLTSLCKKGISCMKTAFWCNQVHFWKIFSRPFLFVMNRRIDWSTTRAQKTNLFGIFLRSLCIKTAFRCNRVHFGKNLSAPFLLFISRRIDWCAAKAQKTNLFGIFWHIFNIFVHKNGRMHKNCILVQPSAFLEKIFCTIFVHQKQANRLARFKILENDQNWYFLWGL